MNKIDQIIQNTQASFAMEDMKLSQEDTDLIRECLEGKADFSLTIVGLVQKFSKKEEE